MKKPEAYQEVIDNVLDYIDAQNYINSILGFDQRIAQTKFPDQGSHLDYWRYMIDCQFGNFSNDSFMKGTISFQEIYEELQEEFGDEDWKFLLPKFGQKNTPGLISFGCLGNINKLSVV